MARKTRAATQPDTVEKPDEAAGEQSDDQADQQQGPQTGTAGEAPDRNVTLSRTQAKDLLRLSDEANRDAASRQRVQPAIDEILDAISRQL